ncbi:MAG: Rieske family iron-sulfur cluster-binding protein [Parcubacteria group bacterium Gr01-1014_38]|nr:MAG: Rieske family iron-sulfur cluster-binding protein [Parcubacteria group bacterium Gr01-1014_38]
MAQQTSLWLTREPDVQRFPKLSANVSTDVVVVGGGIAGVSAAYFLTRAGKKVVLLEANHLGTGETGFTTAFLTSSVDPPLSLLREQFGDAHIRQVRAAGEETIRLIETLVAEEALRAGFHRLDALAVGLTADTVPHLAREAEALRIAGGVPTLLGAEELRALTGVEAVGAVRIPLQGAFDVRAFLLGLAERLQRRGGQIFEESRVTEINQGMSVTVKTATATVTAEGAVLATGLFPSPHKEHNRHFRQMVTYVVALELPEGGRSWRLPDFLYWDIATPFHYMRFVNPVRGHASNGVNGSFLIGGEDLPLPEASKAGEKPWSSLEAFAKTFLPDERWRVTHQWRGQTLETEDALPVAGVPPGGNPKIFLTSGFGGNGMTFGTSAGKVIADLMTGALQPGNNPFRFERETLKKGSA